LTGKTHQVIGVAAALGSFFVWQEPSYAPATLVGVIVASHFGALLPDLDSAAADIYDSVPMGKQVGKVTSKFTFGHRNLTHSILGVILFGYLSHQLIFWTPLYWGINLFWTWLAFMIGYISHLLADTITVLGIPLLWPIDKNFGFPPKPFEGIRIQSGKWFENLVIFPLINLVLIGVVWINLDSIKEVLFK